MKKFLISVIVGVGLPVFAGSFSITLPANSFTNVAPYVGGSAVVTAVTIQATTATNTTAQLIDTPTNQLSLTVGAYTNTVSYATNIVQSYTNYYGVAYSWTNVVLVDITNNPVASSTFNYPVRMNIAAAASTTVTYSPLYLTFGSGVWATNTSVAPCTITVTYRQ